MRRKALGAVLFLATGLGACSSVSTPALRHETGDTLGGGHARLAVDLESSRMYPLLASSSAAAGIAQPASVYEGGRLGVSGTYGIGPRFDLSLRTTYQLGGGGWHLGGKYRVWGTGPIAVGAQLGYGRYSSKGSLTLMTAAQPTDVNQTLSAAQLDLSLPVSYRFTKETALYGGVTLYRTAVSGSSESAVISATTVDFGLNLGLRYGFGRFEVELEGAALRVYDPFEDSMRIVPFWGISGGLSF